MEKTMDILNKEDKFLLANKIKNMAYTKEAIREFKSSVVRIRKFFRHLIYGEAFQKIKARAIRQGRRDREIMLKNKLGSFLNNAILAVNKGDYFYKCNLTTNKKQNKFF